MTGSCRWDISFGEPAWTSCRSFSISGKEIILFDEAISSLDAHTQVQVMDLLIDLKEKLNLTYVFITHDLTSVTYLCDQVLFLYRGHITECCPVRELGKTTDEYARRLLQAIV